MSSLKKTKSSAPKIKDDFRTLTGAEKSAILIMSLGEENAVELFRHMDEEEIKEISNCMASLGTVTSNLIEKLLIDFADNISSTSSLTGSFESTEKLLLKVMEKDKVSQIMEDIRGPAGRTMWDKLGNVSEELLANYLKNEYPQTVSVILSKIKPDHAARVLSILPENFALEVVMRMLRMESIQKDVLEDIEKTLRTEFMSNLARTNRRDAHEMLAEIFNNFERTTESRFMEQLEDKNRDSAERIKALMFTFEDLIKLDSAGIQTLLRNVDKSQLALALKGASEEIKDLFFSNMSERAGKILREDMSAMGPVRLKDVEESQSNVVLTAKQLADKGEIVIAVSKGDDELVY